MEELAREYISNARQLATNGSLSKAFDLYVTAFEKCPAIKNRHEAEFRGVVNKLNEVLAQADKMEEIFTNFGRAMGFYPTNKHIVNDVGKYLYKFGFYSEAWCHFQKALRLDSGFVNAEKNLNSVKNLLIDRLHFRMLNDKIRNEAYRTAIADTINPYLDSVLDLGSGTCLLSIYAHKHHPITVTAVETNEVMTQLSECITQGIGINDIIIVNQVATTLDYRDIGGKRSLLISQMFDAGLFGENILEGLVHAWEYLLTSISRVLPKKAEFFIVGANCDHLHHKYRLSEDAKNMLSIHNLDVHVTTFGGDYDCEDVSLFKDMKFLTENQSVLKVDFNDPKDLKEKLERTEPYQVSIKAKESATINVYIGWFNLHLTDKITITTNPQSGRKSTAWQQAVFFNTANRIVRANETINVDVYLNKGKFSMTPADYIDQTVRVSPEGLRFINDPEFSKLINGCIGMASVYLGQMADLSQVTIIDLCPFPLFGFLMLKRGAQSLTCLAKTVHDEEFFKKVFEANDIPISNVKILVGEDWTVETFGDEKYHAVFCHIIDNCGDLETQNKDVAFHLRENHLYQGGLFLPSDVKLNTQVISSKWLDLNNHIYAENTGGIDIGSEINKFKVSQNFCLDFENLEYTPLTDPVILGSFMYPTPFETAIIPVTKAGVANAVLCWYTIELMEEMDELTTKRGSSFADGTAFLVDKIPVTTDTKLKLTRASDTDASFKVAVEVETN